MAKIRRRRIPPQSGDAARLAEIDDQIAEAKEHLGKLAEALALLYMEREQLRNPEETHR